MVQRFNIRLVAAAVAISLAAVPLAAATVVDSRTIYLDAGQTAMIDLAKEVLDEILIEARADSTLRVTITGHTDRTGSEEANLKVSAGRAQEVADYFIGKGITAGRITVVGKGESEPFLPTADGVREPLNRRVVIELVRP